MEKPWNFCPIFSQSTVKFLLNHWNSLRTSTNNALQNEIKEFSLSRQKKKKGQNQNYTPQRETEYNSHYSLEGYKINHKINSKRSSWRLYWSSDQEQSECRNSISIWAWAGPSLSPVMSPTYSEVKPAASRLLPHHQSSPMLRLEPRKCCQRLWKGICFQHGTLFKLLLSVWVC